MMNEKYFRKSPKSKFKVKLKLIKLYIFYMYLYSEYFWSTDRLPVPDIQCFFNPAANKII